MQRPLFSFLVFTALLATRPLVAEEQTPEQLLTVQSQVQQVLDHVRKAVVAVECGSGTASGVIVNSAGLVFTAAHVTGEPGKKVKITLSDGRTVEGKSLGVDSTTDAAMIQLPAPAKVWPSISINRNSASPRPGAWCFALGHPGGLDRDRGPVLRVGKIVKTASNMLQTDCVLMGGDSGGPLFDMKGDLIGIHSMIWKGMDQNLHVSMAPFLRSWDAMNKGQVIRTWDQGSGAYIGLSTKGGDTGLLVQAIATDSPAGKAGLAEGDQIISINNTEVKTPVEFSDAIRSRTAGQVVTLKVKNTRGERYVEVKLGKRPEK